MIITPCQLWTPSPHPCHVTNAVLHRLYIGVLSLVYHIPACVPIPVPPYLESLSKSNSQPLLHLHPYPTACTSLHLPLVLSVGNRTQWGRGGNVKEGLKLTPMSSFNVEHGGVNSGPDSHGILE